MSFCLLPEKVNDFRTALKNKDIKIVDLMKMSTEDRTALLREYAGNDASEVNRAFEEKLVLKNKALGLRNWASKLGGIGKYSAEGKAKVEQALSDYHSGQQERIFNPKEEEAFLNDLADKKLGVHISREVAAKVFELSQKTQSLKDVDPTMSGVSDAYLKAKNELHDYVESQKPVSTAASIGKNVLTTMRNFLLMNPATPVKTSIGQTLNSAIDLFTRRASIAGKGENHELVKQANADAWKTFRETGFNTTSMESLDDMGRLGEKQNFAAPTGGGKGIVDRGARLAARVTNKIAIDWEHNIPFTKFHQKAFFDSANLWASKLASESKGKLSSSDIFTDAARIEPQTKEGEIVRAEAQKQAARVTSTNDTVLGNLALRMKNTLNGLIPGLPLGDIVAPIAKIPANIIANGIENAGVGIPLGIKDIFQGRSKIQSEDLATRYEGMGQYARGIQRLVRTTGTIGAAALLTSQLSKQDFRDDTYGNHFVLIGDRWINTEYIAAISPALAGMMEAKQQGGDATNQAFQYGRGASLGLLNTPVVGELPKIFTAITSTNPQKSLTNYGTSWMGGRIQPAFAKSLESSSPIEHLFFGATGAQTREELKQSEAASAKKATATRKATAAAPKRFAQPKN